MHCCQYSNKVKQYTGLCMTINLVYSCVADTGFYLILKTMPTYTERWTVMFRTLCLGTLSMQRLACAVSNKVYPASSASWTARAVCFPRPAVPKPMLGITMPLFSVTCIACAQLAAEDLQRYIYDRAHMSQV